jgi:phage FluMu gp28-like protein
MGRRWGKSTLGIHRLAKPALAGKPTGWFAPSYKYLSEAWRDFHRVLKPIIVRSSATDRRIEVLGGGSIEFWSLVDPDAGRSRKYQRVVIDEAAKAPNLEATWNEAIRATLADYRGDADFLSTPKGHNFFWKAFAWGEERRDGEWMSWRFPTASNPFIAPEEIEAARKQLPERVYQQEFEATFLDDAGGVFRNVCACIDRGRNTNEPAKKGLRNYSTGIDLARTEDFTVITTLDWQGKQVYFERFNQISWERQIAAIKAALAKYPGTAYMDTTGVGDPIYEACQKIGCRIQPYQFTNASKVEIIDGLALAFERGQIRLMDIPEQENELIAFEYQMTPGSRTVKMAAPEGMHDDCVIALALARHGQGAPRLPLLMSL